MSVRRRARAAAGPALGLALALTLASAPASAQVSAAPLAQVDPWGVGWLSRNEAAASTIWANTTTDALTPLFTQLQPIELSPASRAALRRIVLSGAKGPPDSNVLTPERLRIIEQLGETERALELRKRFPDMFWAADYERLASNYDLINNRKESACSRISDKRADDGAWMPVRAFCLALAGDFNGATLIGENLPTGPDGGSDAWLLAAISAMDPAVKTRPEGRYANAFDAAVSIAAKLSAPPAAFASMPPDIAAAIVLHPDATPAQRRAALRPALDSPRIKSADVLAVLTAEAEAPSTPAPRGQQRATPRVDFLVLALVTANDPGAEPEERAVAFAAALKSAETQADFRLASLALADAIKALPKGVANAETFARAALAVGDAKTAGDWRKQIDETTDPWTAARIDLMLTFAGANSGKPGESLDRLIAALPPAPETANSAAPASRTAATPAARQLDLRRIENTRMLFLFTGTGRSLSPDQRALLFTQKAAGRGVSDAAIARIASAADQDANGEAALAAISLMGADTSALSFAGLADLLAQLREAGFEKEADAFALESLQVWKAM